MPDPLTAAEKGRVLFYVGGARQLLPPARLANRGPYGQMRELIGYMLRHDFSRVLITDAKRTLPLARRLEHVDNEATAAALL